jgi:predicted small lipoprotein YifL
MKIQIAGLFVVASLFLMSACGQKGPLYLKNEPVPEAATADVEKVAEENETDSKMPAPTEKKD